MHACRYAALAPCFNGFTGKLLAVEWIGHLTKRVSAQGGDEGDAHAIYEAFHAELRRSKAQQQRQRRHEEEQQPRPQPQHQQGPSRPRLAAAHRRLHARCRDGAGDDAVAWPEVEVLSGPPVRSSTASTVAGVASCDP